MAKLQARRTAWPLIGATILVTIVWMSLVDLRVARGGLGLVALASLGCEALSLVYRVGRPDPRLAATLTAIAQIVAFSAAGGCLSYVVVAGGHGPLWGSMLSSWDMALGLDWRGYVAFVDARPWLAWTYGVAYASFAFQLILVPIVLGFSGHTRALGDFVLAFMLAALAVILVSALMPAVEMYVHLGLRPQELHNIPPTGAYERAAILASLRDGTLNVIVLGQIEGIITFPSLHTAAGVIVILTLWPWRVLRWPILALNVLMVAATPVYGGHYFVDVLAGTAVAVLAVVAAGALGRQIAVDGGRQVAKVGGPSPAEA